MILETPNPNNVSVGSHLFYTDPTHLRPLPPASMQFFVEQNGFAEVKLHELNPHPSYKSELDRQQLTDTDLIVNDKFFGPQDYSLIAFK